MKLFLDHVQIALWSLRVRLSRVPPGGSPEFVAILLSYKRPQNMEKICRALLKTPSIQKIILSNNNPSIHIRDWVHLTDPRIVIVEQSKPTACQMRFLLAKQDNGEHFFFMDDDLFLLPKQIEHLCNNFRTDPSVPLGIQGQVYHPQEGALQYAVYGNRTVDGLNRVYLCTKGHITEFFRIIDLLSKSVGSSGWERHYWDDMVLSRCGKSRPRIIAPGPYPNCPTNALPGIAEWRDNDFFPYRVTLHHQLDASVPFRA